MIQINVVERVGTLCFESIDDVHAFMVMLDKAHRKAGWKSLPRMEVIEFNTDDAEEKP